MLGSLGVGLIIGAVATALLFSGWATRVPMSATPLAVEMPSRLTVNIGTDSAKGIMLRRDSQTVTVAPPRNVVWTKMVPAKSANSVFLLAYEQIGDSTYHWPSVYRIDLPRSGQPLSSNQVNQILSHAATTQMVGDAIIEELDGASEDGRRILLTLAFREPASDPSATYVRRRPYYLYTGDATNMLSEILP